MIEDCKETAESFHFVEDAQGQPPVERDHSIQDTERDPIVRWAKACTRKEGMDLGQNTVENKIHTLGRGPGHRRLRCKLAEDLPGTGTVLYSELLRKFV